MDFLINSKSDFKQQLDEVKNEKRLGIHSFHRYYGKLIPGIPRTSIRKYTEMYDLVFDPFSGSGTTGVESIFSNRNFVGVELSKLSKDISEVKTSILDTGRLQGYFDEIVELFENVSIDGEEPPFCVNREHWFKPHIQDQMMKIDNAINSVNYHKDIYKKFFKITLSAIVKNVSNADERHVFPGVSKRMRALEAEKPIMKNAFEVYIRAVKKRINYYDVYRDSKVTSKIIHSDSSQVNLNRYSDKVDLIVTNPPYISSVRYVETMKLELYWMKYIADPKEYKELSKQTIGNDKYNKGEFEKVKYTKYDEINNIIDHFATIDLKSARIVSDYFNKMENVIKKCYSVLKDEKRMVVKIADSRIKKFKVETGKLLTLIATSNGFELEDLYIDEIQSNSRSLTTARNSYSDIIMYDYILVWRKKNANN